MKYCSSVNIFETHSLFPYSPVWQMPWKDKQLEEVVGCFESFKEKLIVVSMKWYIKCKCWSTDDDASSKTTEWASFKLRCSLKITGLLVLIGKKTSEWKSSKSDVSFIFNNLKKNGTLWNLSFSIHLIHLSSRKVLTSLQKLSLITLFVLRAERTIFSSQWTVNFPTLCKWKEITSTVQITWKILIAFKFSCRRNKEKNCWLYERAFSCSRLRKFAQLRARKIFPPQMSNFVSSLLNEKHLKMNGIYVASRVISPKN